MYALVTPPDSEIMARFICMVESARSSEKKNETLNRSKHRAGMAVQEGSAWKDAGEL